MYLQGSLSTSLTKVAMMSSMVPRLFVKEVHQLSGLNAFCMCIILNFRSTYQNSARDLVNCTTGRYIVTGVCCSYIFLVIVPTVSFATELSNKEKPG